MVQLGYRWRLCSSTCSEWWRRIWVKGTVTVLCQAARRRGKNKRRLCSSFEEEVRNKGAHLESVHFLWSVTHETLINQALPTAELSISNCRAQLVGPLGSGVRTISTVLNITRLHSAMSGVASLRRCLVMSKEYARTRHIAGNHNQLLGDNSMHTNALLKPELTHRALLHLVFGSIHLLGRSEALGVNFDPKEQWRLRLLTPVVKSFCAELSTTELPDLMASLGGQGYMSENQFGR